MHDLRARVLSRSSLVLLLALAASFAVSLTGSTMAAHARERNRGSRGHHRTAAAAPPVTALGAAPAVGPAAPPTSTATPGSAPAVTPVLAPAASPAVAPTPAPASAPQPAIWRAPAPAPSPAPRADFFIGAYVPGVPDSIQPLNGLESKLGTKLAVVNYFQGADEGFTRGQATNAAKNGSTPLITLEFWDYTKGVSQPRFRLNAISGGSFDAYLRRYARDAKAYGKTVWLRPLHEMNGSWYPWAGTVNGNKPADFVGAWRHIHDIFAEEGAGNVKFVWCPNATSVPNTSANSIPSYWPGSSYVDFMGIDGYNFGGSDWHSFSGVFGSAYSTIAKLSSKPIIIPETACSPVGGDKAAWIADMFDVLPKAFPRVSGLVWFNTNKEKDWRIESSAATLKAFKSGASTFGL